MMRVAYVTAAPFLSGAERSLQTTLMHVEAAGIQPLLICPPDAAIVPWCEQAGVPFAFAPHVLRDKWHPLRWWKGVRTLRAILREHRIERVHSNQLWSYQAVGTSARSLGIPRACHMRDEVTSDALAWYLRAGVEGVLSISDFIGRQVTEAWPSRLAKPQFETLTNPVAPAGKATSKANQEGDLLMPDDAGDGITFGLIGQLVPVKGCLELLEALSGLPTNVSWRLLVAGCDTQPGAPYEKACRARVAELGWADRVTFLGFLEDVAPLYRRIDVAVVPSLREPWGRIPFEAASHGVPTIASDVGGLSETIDDGTTGWLVPPGNVSALRDALHRCVVGLDPSIGQQAKQRMASQSDPVAYVHTLRRFYDGLGSSKDSTHQAGRP